MVTLDSYLDYMQQKGKISCPKTPLQVQYVNEGLEAIIFTAQGDMRQALNNLQATYHGFGFVNAANVFKVCCRRAAAPSASLICQNFSMKFSRFIVYMQVCDEPSPLMVQEMLEFCKDGKIEEAYQRLSHLWKLGYSPEDIIGNIFRVCKTSKLPEYLKLMFIKVRNNKLYI